MKKLALLGGLALSLMASSLFAADKPLRLGIEAAYPPFAFKQADGSIAGFDVDIGVALCAEMKVECQWVEQEFDGLIPSLKVKKVAEAMLAIAPDQAMTARFGGEEFVMLVPNASIDRAQQLAEKVRTSIERLRLVRRHDKLEIAPFTISVGVALRQREESIEPLFDRADKALYRAKHNGRNCVVASS